MATELKLPHYAKHALATLISRKQTLCRQCSDTDEARTKGGGYLYFRHPGGGNFPTVSGKLLIDEKAVEPIADGLFEGTSQSFVPSRAAREFFGATADE